MSGIRLETEVKDFETANPPGDGKEKLMERIKGLLGLTLVLSGLLLTGCGIKYSPPGPKGGPPPLGGPGQVWNLTALSGTFGVRSGHSSLSFIQQMWVIGGKNSNGYLNDVRYSSDGKTWTLAASAPFSPRADHASVVFNNNMWVIGGQGGGSDVWHSSDGKSWSQATTVAGFGARYGMAALD